MDGEKVFIENDIVNGIFTLSCDGISKQSVIEQYHRWGGTYNCMHRLV